MFLQIRHAENYRKVNGLRIQTSCLPEFHRWVEVKGAFNKLKKTREIFLVGAPRFELGTSCAQGRHSDQNNPLVFNATTETKQLSRDRRMWLAVLECPQMFVGWAQKLAHSKWYAGPGFEHGIVRRSHASYENTFRRLGGILVAWT